MVILAFNIHFLQAQVGIGTTDPTSSLTVEGSFSTNTEILAISTTLNDTHHTVIGNNITITLPSPNSIVGREYIIKAGNTGNIIVTPSGSDVIDGSSSSVTLDTYETLKVQSIGSANWIIVNESSSGVEDGDAWGVTGEDTSSDVNRSGDVGIGTSGTPNSKLQVEGSFSLPIKSGSTFYTLTDNDHTFITDGENVRLPSAIGREGRIYIVKNISDDDDTTVYTSGLGQDIDGSSSFEIEKSKQRSCSFQSDGADWWIISSYVAE